LDRPSVSATRELLESAFTAETLRRFCQDRDLFRPILASFGSRQGLDDMVDRAIEYCEKQALLNELLYELEKANPRQFARFESSLWNAE